MPRTRQPLLTSACRKGTTLLEMLVVIGVLLCMLVVAGSLVAGLPVLRLARHEDIALKIATSQIDTLRAGGYGALPSSGSFSDSLLSSLPSGAGSNTISAFNAETKQVTVTVSWVESSGQSHSVSLTSLMTEVGGL